MNTIFRKHFNTITHFPFFLKDQQGRMKRGGRKRENTELAGVMGFFHFHLLTISYHGN